MKYSYAQRLEIVKMVLEKGYSYSEVVRLKGSNVKSIRHWVAHYQTRGQAGLSLKNSYYDNAFKKSVILYLQENRLSLFATAIKFGIPDERLVRRWLHIYQKEGIDGLCCSNGDRIKKMKSSKKPIKSSSQDEDLRKELEYLRAENAYLKKLQALVQARIEREKGSALPPLKN